MCTEVSRKKPTASSESTDSRAETHALRRTENHTNIARHGRKIDILEIIGKSSILVSWQSATEGRYGHQTWVKGLARHAGICAFSGMPISYRQEVYKPKVSAGQRPLNWYEMILAATPFTTELHDE